MADANIVYQQEETCGILWVNLVNSPCTFRCESPLLPNVGFHRTVRLGMNEHNVHILKLAIRKPLEIYIGWAARPQPHPPKPPGSQPPTPSSHCPSAFRATIDRMLLLRSLQLTEIPDMLLCIHYVFSGMSRSHCYVHV